MSNQKKPYPSFWLVLVLVALALGVNGTLKYIGGLGESSSAEKTVSDYANEKSFKMSDYPAEIINMFKMNEETKDFVLNYPSKIVDFQPDPIDFSEYRNCEKPPQLMQWDLRWGYMTYNNGVMGLTGSAPTALSMAALYELHDTSITPVHVVEFAKGSALEGKPEKLLSEGARAMSLTVTEVPKNDNRVRQAVSEPGAVVVCLTNGRNFSTAIVIRGIDKDGKYLINDTMSIKRSEGAYDFSQLQYSIRKVWQYTTTPIN